MVPVVRVVPLVAVVLAVLWGLGLVSGVVPGVGNSRADEASPTAALDPAAEFPAELHAIGLRALQEKDLRGAARWLRLAAERGHAPAQLALGNLLLDGIGVPANPAEGVAWVRRAALQGEPAAQTRLGLLLASGRGVGADPAAAVGWFRQAAEQEDAIGQRELGLRLLDGRGAPADPAAAVDWLRQAAVQGDRQAQQTLGVLYREGRGVEADPVEAAWWFRQAAEADPAGAGSRGE